MIRILAYLPTPGGLTGAPRRLLTLAGTLRDQGIDMCIASESGSCLLAEAHERGYCFSAIDSVGVLALRHGALFGNGFLFRASILAALFIQNYLVFRLIQKSRSNAVWMRGSKSIAFGVLGAFCSRRPLIWDVDYEPVSKGVVRLMHIMGLWSAHAVVFQYSSAPDKIFGQELARRYRHKFKSIIPGIDLSSLSRAAALRRARKHLAGQPFVVLQVGTICDRKNQSETVDALIRIKLLHPDLDFTCWLAGGIFEPEYAQLLSEKIKAHGLNECVQILGWQDDVVSLMVEADLLVMPSKDEGVPNTIQEAMAIGLPVVVSDVGGMPDIVQNAETGWILPLGRQDLWADRIAECISDDRICSKVSAAARSYAEKHFDTVAWGADYARVVESSQA
jgi:glycosyltransferase involved in cell wall biosynthesis